MAVDANVVDVDAFMRDGFTVIRQAVAPKVIEECRAVIFDQLRVEGVDVGKPDTWQPLVRINCPAGPAFAAAGTSPKLQAAYDQLIGTGRWTPNEWVGGTVPARFPAEEYPGEVGWHIDGNEWDGEEYLVDARSVGRGLLGLFLFTDVSEADAPTRLISGSHPFVANAFTNVGDKPVRIGEVLEHLPPSVYGRTTAHATGKAGDVWLCHPFTLHTATWPHRGTGPRLIAQPAIECPDGFRIDGSDPSPVGRGMVPDAPAAD